MSITFNSIKDYLATIDDLMDAGYKKSFQFHQGLSKGLADVITEIKIELSIPSRIIEAKKWNVTAVINKTFNSIKDYH